MARKSSTKFLSNKQEKKVAKDLGGRTVIASGSLWGMKADARSDDYLIECKTTKNSYYLLKYETWEKIAKEALKDGMRIPVMAIELENSTQVAVFDVDDIMNLPEESLLKDLGYEEVYVNNQLSFRVTSIPSVVVDSETMLTLVVMPWQDFLDLI
jgi:hypothetical protein